MLHTNGFSFFVFHLKIPFSSYSNNYIALKAQDSVSETQVKTLDLFIFSFHCFKLINLLQIEVPEHHSTAVSIL